MIHLKLCRLGARIHKHAIQMIRAIVLLAWGIGCQFAMALEEPAISNLRVALQAKYADLVEVKLNSVTEDVKFQIVDMRTSMVELEGKRYCAFRFKTGDKVHQLTWCFRKPPGLQSWYIFPESGTMNGFNHFDEFINGEEEEWGSLGDSFLIQSLPSTNFKPNTGYIMWFQISDAADSSINLSLNMTNVPDHSRYSAVFPSIKL